MMLQSENDMIKMRRIVDERSQDGLDDVVHSIYLYLGLCIRSTSVCSVGLDGVAAYGSSYGRNLPFLLFVSI